ncbi:MAG: hypothetical protein H3C38_09055 [Rhodospirillales bacterium]|nr:hypothetical protein [Rhodospirillales bacterium]
MANLAGKGIVCITGCGHQAITCFAGSPDRLHPLHWPAGGGVDDQSRYPMVKGTGRFGSETDLYVGNGDTVTFA